ASNSPRGYRPSDEPDPINAYGRSKLEGERLAAAAYHGAAAALGIVRTAWLFGPPGNDFPDKILRPADAARAAGEPLRLVADETGSPTHAPDPAGGIADLAGAGATVGEADDRSVRRRRAARQPAGVRPGEPVELADRRPPRAPLPSAAARLLDRRQRPSRGGAGRRPATGHGRRHATRR